MLAARVEPRVLREKRISSIGAGVELEIGDKGFSGSFLKAASGNARRFVVAQRHYRRAGPGRACHRLRHLVLRKWLRAFEQRREIIVSSTIPRVDGWPSSDGGAIARYLSSAHPYQSTMHALKISISVALGSRRPRLPTRDA